VEFIACLMALLLQKGILNDATAMPFGIAIGLLCGMLNGVLVAYTNVEPFIITLGTMSMFQGAALVTANGTVVTIGDSFSWFGTIRWLTIPIQIYIFIILAVAVFLVMKYTKYGRRLYAIGGNPEAARLAGINIRRNKFVTYIANGFFCTVAAMIVLSKLSAANANMASGYEMQAITACVVGGVSLSGGRGNTIGCFMGIMLIGIISNALNLLMVPTFYHHIIIGAVLLAAVILRTGKGSNN
jgi:ribose/xylose/arabinose/galactoside ABC-type transport system permease subunit